MAESSGIRRKRKRDRKSYFLPTIDETASLPVIGDQVQSCKAPPVGFCVPNMLGTMIFFGRDRIDDHDHCFVVGRDESGENLAVIFPRFKCILETSKLPHIVTDIVLGQDRTTERFFFSSHCTCELHYGHLFECTCGAESANVNQYADSFREASPDQLYQVKWICPDKEHEDAVLIEPMPHRDVPVCLPIRNSPRFCCRQTKDL